MNRLTRLPFLLAALLVVALGSDAARAAPAGLPEQALDIELREAEVASVFALLGQISKRTIALDPCVQGKVDIKLKNTPLPLVFDALALKMHFTYEDDGSAIHVRCQGDAASADSVLDTRVTIAVKAASLPDMLSVLVTAAHLEGVDYRASARPAVTMEIGNVRLGTALAAVRESTGLKVFVTGRRLVVTD